MLKRKIEVDLIAWKNNKNRKPLIISVCSMIKQFQSVHYPDFSTRISDKK